MSLILVATVGGVLLERCVVARRSGVWGYAGAERWTRPATVRGPPPPCSTDHDARSPEESRGQEQSAASRGAVGARPRPRGAVLGVAAHPAGRPAVPVVGARPVLALGTRRDLRGRRAVTRPVRRAARPPRPRAEPPGPVGRLLRRPGRPGRRGAGARLAADVRRPPPLRRRTGPPGRLPGGRRRLRGRARRGVTPDGCEH